MKYITYGLGNYDLSKFNEIKNRKYFIKPMGGLWCSPVNSNWGWKDWCESNEFTHNNGFSDWFEFELLEDTKIYKINTYLDLVRIPYKIDNMFIDFEKMKTEYDAIWLTEEGLYQTSSFDINILHDINLYGWDCESLLIMNKDVIKNIINFSSSNKED